jgi:hypothetical protein
MIKLISKLTHRLTNILSKKIDLEKILRFLTIFRLVAKRIYQKKHRLPGNLIVSLTSYPPRFPTLHLTISNLLTQSAHPDKVILWVSEEDYKLIPRNILRLESINFSIQKTKENTRSYKKIIPSPINYPDSFIVTTDDDIYYNYDWLNEFIDSYNPNIKEVIGHRGHQITFNDDNTTKPYIKWRWCIGNKSSGSDIFLTGCGGVLYPPNALYKDVINSGLFMRECGTADDVWLHFMTRLNGFTPKKIPSNFREFAWQGSQVVNLNSANVDQGTNDLCIKNLEAIYGKLIDIKEV